ncbi:MAG: DUF2203 domain-containing protein [Planctomycetaceae bacterium]
MIESEHKYYTIEEANRTLPLVGAIVRDIVDLYSDVHERRERLARLPSASHRDDRTPYSEEVAQIEAGIDADIERLQAFTDELESLGVELKDPLIGLIDFYSLMDGREVYLCWKLGEGDVAYWHELDAGFAGRQTLYESSVTGETESGDSDA